jgi:formylglycine-generating enzyme required for sulfatase activity
MLMYNDFSTKGFYVEEYKGYLDDRVLIFKDWESEYNAKSHRISGVFALKVDTNLYMDETETANIHWQEFLYYIRRDSSEALYKRMLPDSNAFPIVNYFSEEFYRYYPVVGVTKQQVEAYLTWKTEVIEKNYENLSYRVVYRLPTEEEWERAASGGLETEKYPYGVESLNVKVKVNPKASKYLSAIIDSTVSETQVENDIRIFNKSKPEMAPFFIKQNGMPYFLQFKTPFYVYNPLKNKYGLINMIGNVAEMINEEGIAKGGSYTNELSDSKIKDKTIFSVAAPNVGFRAIAEIINK